MTGGAEGARPGDHDAVRRAYDRWARSYDDDVNRTRDLAAAVLRGAPLRLDGRDVVELGCGTGRNTSWMATRARSLTAMDLSPGMLATARERVPHAHVRFVEHDVRERWPLPDASADVVVGTLVLEHVDGLAHVYAEAARVLRAGATAFLCELHPERQRRGARAHFTDRETGAVTHVPAHRHTTSEYVNAGIAAGLRLAALDEWVEEGAPADAPPRLLSLRFARPAS